MEEVREIVRQINRKTLLIVVVMLLALCSVAAVGLFYMLNKGRRQRVLFESAERYVEQEDYSRALLQYKRAISLGNATAEMYYAYGLCLEKHHQPRHAFRAFERAAQVDPDHVASRKRIVEVYYVQARAALARPEAEPEEVKALARLEACARALVRLRPSEREGHLWLARAKLLQGDEEGALRRIDEALAWLPGDEEIVAERARLLLQAGRTSEAEAAIGKALADRAESTAFLLTLAAVQRAGGRREEELETLVKVAGIDPRNAAARRALGLLHWADGREAEAESALATLCEIEGDRAENWILLARFRMSTGEVEAGIEALRRAHEANPRDASLLAELARAQLEAKKVADAGATVGKLKKMKAAANVVAWLEGSMELARGRVAPAKSKFLLAIRKSKREFAEAHLALATCYKAEGNFGAAEEEYVLAARSPRLRSRAWLALAETHLLAGRADRALAQCAEVKKLYDAARSSGRGQPRREAVLCLIMGRAHLLQGELAEAEESFRAGVEVARDASQKATALGGLGRTALVRYVLALRRGEKAEAARHLAGARRFLAEAKALDAENASVAMIEARLANLTGDKERAAALMKRAATSADAAARFIREQVERAASESKTVEAMVAAHGGHRNVLVAASDYFRGLAGAQLVQAGRQAGEERRAVERAAGESRKKAIVYARKAFELDRTNTADALRLFFLLRADQEAAEARALAKELADSSVMKAIGVALEGLLLRDEGRKEEAVRKLKQSVVADEKEWRTHFWLGTVYAGMKEHAAEAEVELGRALELRPTARDARNLLFAVLEREGKYGRVQAEIEKALKRSGNRLALLLRSARLYEKTGDLARAAARWRLITRIASGDFRWHIEYSRVLRRLGRADEAVRAARRAAAEKDSVPALRALILAHLAKGDREAAQEVLSEALKSRPDDPQSSVLARDVYQAMGRTEEAEAELNRLVDRRPGDASARYLLGDFYSTQGRFEEAIAQYEEALRAQPGFAAADMAVARALTAQARSAVGGAAREGHLKRAEERVARLKERYPKNLTPRLLEGDLLLLRGDGDGAERLLHGLIGEFGRSARLRFQLGRLCFERGKIEEAKGQLAGALAQNAQLSEAHLLLARIRVGENRLQDALESCASVLRYEPTHVAALNLSAQIKQRVGRGGDAVSDFQAVARLRPLDRMALMRLTQALLAQRRDREALQVVKEAYARNVDSEAFLEEYVRVLRYVGRLDEAATACRSHLAAHPGSEGARLMLAQVQLAEGKKAEGEVSLAEAEKAAKDVKLFLGRAVNVCMQEKRFEAAAAYARRLTEASPGNAFALGTLINALIAAGRQDEAIEAALEGCSRHGDSVEFLRLAVRAWSAARKLGQAVVQCRTYVAAHPRDVAARLMLVEVAARSGHEAEALQHVEALEAQAGERAAPAVAERLVRFYRMLGRPADARRVAERLCEEDPGRGESWLMYAAVIQGEGPAGREEVISAYRKALSQPLRGQGARMLIVNNLAYALAMKEYGSEAARAGALAEAEELSASALGDRETASTHLLDTSAWIKFLRGKSEEAHELLALATSRPNAVAEIWYHYAMACARTGRSATALEAVKRAVTMDPKRTGWTEDVNREIARGEGE